MARSPSKQELQDRVAELEQEVEDLQAKLDQIADVVGEYDEMYEPDEEEGEEEEEEEEEG